MKVLRANESFEPGALRAIAAISPLTYVNNGLRDFMITGQTDDGMLNFNQSLFNLVKEGKVSEKEALSKASNPQALEMNFKGIFLDDSRRILE